MTQSNAITPREFALALHRMLGAREESYIREGSRRGGYRLTWTDAAALTVPEPWREIAVCLGVSGYSEVWDWVEEWLTPAAQPVSANDSDSKEG